MSARDDYQLGPVAGLDFDVRAADRYNDMCDEIDFLRGGLRGVATATDQARLQMCQQLHRALYGELSMDGPGD